MVLRTRAGMQGAEKIGNGCISGQMLITGENKPSYTAERNRKSSVQKIS